MLHDRTRKKNKLFGARRVRDNKNEIKKYAVNWKKL